jgi:hypothetical protein
VTMREFNTLALQPVLRCDRHRFAASVKLRESVRRCSPYC